MGDFPQHRDAIARFTNLHPENVFAGVDLDPDQLREGLDACLLAADEIDDSLQASLAEDFAPASTASARLH